MQYFRPTRSLIVVLTFALSLPGEFAFALQNPDPLPPPPQSVLEQNATALPDAPSAAKLAQATTPAPAATPDPNAPQTSPSPNTPQQPEVVPVGPEQQPSPETEQDQASPDQTGPGQQPQPDIQKPETDAGPATPPQDDLQAKPIPPATQPDIDQEPAGTAAAQKGRTAGGAASKPAGVAIAPAKQKRSWSFVMKLGAIAAGAAALGTVYALSRSTGSTPPGAGR
jgi:hypothetical protein